jgi:ABC-type arginine transport system permease subunit
MKNFLLGIVIGIIVIILFIYFGGGRALKSLGMMTTDLGERIETVEKSLKDTTQDLIKKKK